MKLVKEIFSVSAISGYIASSNSCSALPYLTLCFKCICLQFTGTVLFVTTSICDAQGCLAVTNAPWVQIQINQKSRWKNQQQCTVVVE